MAVGAGPLYVNAVMGQAPSAAQRDHVRKTGLQITTRHDIDVEESEQPSRPDSWSMHYDRTDQAPYSLNSSADMLTQTSLLNLPKDNPSRELAFFLKTTGPTAPHRRPSKIEQNPRRNVPTPKHALRFLKLGNKRPLIRHPHRESAEDLSLHQSNADRGGPSLEWQDEGGLLSGKGKKSKYRDVERVASPFAQEVSSTGMYIVFV